MKKTSAALRFAFVAMAAVLELSPVIGDSPLIGAGNFAEDDVCAVSCTGRGEPSIRSAVAYDVAARMKYAGRDLATAER